MHRWHITQRLTQPPVSAWPCSQRLMGKLKQDEGFLPACSSHLVLHQWGQKVLDFRWAGRPTHFPFEGPDEPARSSCESAAHTKLRVQSRTPPVTRLKRQGRSSEALGSSIGLFCNVSSEMHRLLGSCNGVEVKRDLVCNVKQARSLLQGFDDALAVAVAAVAAKVNELKHCWIVLGSKDNCHFRRVFR